MPNLFTRDIEAAMAFYRDQLGFTVSYQVPEHVVLGLGGSRLALSSPGAVRSAGLEPGTGNAFELVVSCDDVDMVVSRLRAAGVAVLCDPYDHRGGHRRAYVADPDGNWVAIVDAS